MRPYSPAFLLIGWLITVAGCSQKTSEALKPEAAHVSGSSAATVSNAGLKFAIPPGWISESPASSNRQAQFKLPRAAGDSEDAELVVYYFHGGGGTPQANVDRWIGQFTKPDGTPASDTARITHKDIDGIPVTIVDISGTYTDSMSPMQQSQGAKTHFRMMGAIAEAGNGPWFIKLTGPEKTVAKWESSFESFLNSLKQNR